MIFSTGPIVKVGYISKPHGFEGKLKIVIDSEITINSKEPVFVFMHEKPVPFFLSDIQGKNPLIVKLNTIETFDQAKILAGKDVYVRGSSEIPMGNMHLSGYTIRDYKLGNIGVIQSVVNHGVQQLAIVHYQNEECMIPIVDAFFKHINHQTKLIQATLPDGLLTISMGNNDEEE